MAYKVSVVGFEGPFDLLLQLVLRQRVDIGSVNVSVIADQYLSEVAKMEEVDLEVASDFVLVASTLLDLKASSLVSLDLDADDSQDMDEAEFDDLTADEMRDVLVSRLLAYRAYKAAALSLHAREISESKMHARDLGPEESFRKSYPDCLSGVTLDALASVCASFLGRRELVLLQSEHIAPKRIPLETCMEQVYETIYRSGSMNFEELVEADPTIENRVVNILALLELGKRGVVDIEQRELFGDIRIDLACDASSQEYSKAADARGLV